LNLKELECFVAVAEEAHFTRAASKLHITQPGVSAQIRRLERDLGQRLLERTARRVRLTQVGAAVLPHARRALSSAAGVRVAVSQLTGLLTGRVAVGTVSSAEDPNLFDVLGDFHRLHPQVDLSLTEGSSTQLIDALLEGRLDLALVGLSGAAPDGIEATTVVEDEVVAAVPRTDPLARSRTVRLDGLKARELLCLPRGTGVRSALDAAFSAGGLLPRITCQASNPNVLAALAARGLGVALLPSSVVHAYGRPLRAVRLSPRLRSRVALAWKRDAPSSPAAEALLAMSRSRL
jgi:DNA-binding transcriptional LysR family regulator